MLAGMGMRWLFGPDGENQWAFEIQPRVYDIDIVRDVYRILDTEATSALEIFKSSAEYTDRFASPEAQESAEAKLLELASIRAVVQETTTNASVKVMKDVPIDIVGEVSAHVRSSLVVSAGQVWVGFRQGEPPTVAGRTAPYLGHLADPIAKLLRAEGRRRVQWKSLIRFVPALLASALTVAGVWVQVDVSPPLSVSILGAVALLTSWIAAAALQPRIATRYAHWSSGHRFREGSRAAVRERLANSRATALVSLVTIPLGGLLGYLTRVWFGG